LVAAYLNKTIQAESPAFYRRVTSLSLCSKARGENRLSSTTITFVILAGIVVLFVSNRVPVVLVAIGTALALYFSGVLNLDQSLRGFGDPAVIFIASLFVVSAGLDATGVTAWAGQGLIARAGQSRVRLLVLTMVLVALLTALISINGAVAALLPVVIVMAVRVGRSPSQLLMPLVFSAHSGSLLALTGTPVNVLVAEAAADAGLAPFGFFSFAIVGVPLLLGTIAIVVLFGQRLLPERSGRTIPSGRAVQVDRWDVPIARAVTFPVCRLVAGGCRPGGICRPDAGHYARRRRRTAAKANAGRGRHSHRPGRRSNRRRFGIRQVAGLSVGGRTCGCR
jgi:hypothetical protein